MKQFVKSFEMIKIFLLQPFQLSHHLSSEAAESLLEIQIDKITTPSFASCRPGKTRDGFPFSNTYPRYSNSAHFS